MYEFARLSQHRTVVSYDPLTITLFYELNATEFIRPLCPVYLRTVLPYITSVRIIILSLPPLINLELSLLIYILLTS